MLHFVAFKLYIKLLLKKRSGVRATVAAQIDKDSMKTTFSLPNARKCISLQTVGTFFIPLVEKVYLKNDYIFL